MTENWLPLEANPEVMKEHNSSMGGPENIEFHDILSYEEWALEMIPKPVLAVILLYPITSQSKQREIEEIDSIKQKGQFLSSKIWHIKQKVGNACGTIGLLHTIANIKDKAPYATGGFIDNFLNKVGMMDPDEKAEQLAKDNQIRLHHERAEKAGQSFVDPENSETSLHFITFVEQESYIYELDGRKPFAINHGQTELIDFFKNTVKVIKDKFISQNPTDLRFSMIAVCKENN